MIDIFMRRKPHNPQQPSGQQRNNNNQHRRPQNRGRTGYHPSEESGDAVSPKLRRHAQNMLDKYTNHVRDALVSGDRVLVEYYNQHLEHYNRVIKQADEQQNAEQEQRNAERQERHERFRQRTQEAEAGSETPQENPRHRQRPHHERTHSERPHSERPHSERNSSERIYQERNSDERPAQERKYTPERSSSSTEQPPARTNIHPPRVEVSSIPESDINDAPAPRRRGRPRKNVDTDMSGEDNSGAQLASVLPAPKV